VRDQKELIASKQDKKMLTEAFKQLPNLTKLVFTDNVSNIPPDVDRRGLVKAHRTTNNRPAQLPSHPGDDEYYDHKDHVWMTLMDALAKSGINTLKHFEVSYHSSPTRFQSS
jgi:hypothetical protein